MVWCDMVEWLVKESTMSSFAALIQITMAIKKHLQCYGSVEIDIFSHQQIQDLTGKWLYVRSLELK